ncbi:MAG: MoaD/ThiS family protein [bacterium]
MPNVTIQYFAQFRDQAGQSEESIDTAATTPRQLFAEVAEKHRFSLNQEDVKVAVNDEFADWDDVLSEGDYLVFIPPVAGG